jgi:hypothetical protein
MVFMVISEGLLLFAEASCLVNLKWEASALAEGALARV